MTETIISQISEFFFPAIAFALFGIYFLLSFFGLKFLDQPFRATCCNHDAVISRMEAYANLKRGGVDRTAGPFASARLSADGFAVLLGTLKKIEQKSATLVAILIFLISALLTVVLGVELKPNGAIEESDLFRIAMSSFALLLIFPLLHAFVGIRQIDQRDYASIKCCRPENSMEKQLIEDLLRKERAFDFSRRAVLTISLTVLLLPFARLLWLIQDQGL